MMVVVPEADHVELHYGRSGVDYLTVMLTLIGIGLCFFWRKVGDVRHAGETPAGFGPLRAPDTVGAPLVADDWRLGSAAGDDRVAGDDRHVAGDAVDGVVGHGAGHAPSDPPTG